MDPVQFVKCILFFSFIDRMLIRLVCWTIYDIVLRCDNILEVLELFTCTFTSLVSRLHTGATALFCLRISALHVNEHISFSFERTEMCKSNDVHLGISVLSTIYKHILLFKFPCNEQKNHLFHAWLPIVLCLANQ